MMPTARTPSAAFLMTLALLVALLHALLALTAKTDQSATVDELAHLTAGYTYNTRNDFRLQPENGNLSQRWTALPLTVAGAPTLPFPNRAWQRGDVWRYGHELFYTSGLPAREMLLAGRGMVALFSAATAWLVFSWSRRCFGWRGGFLSLVLYSFCPAFLAHGALATSDVIMTFFFLASVGAWWRQLEQPGIGRALLSAVVFGLACVSKYSAVLLLPIFLICAMVWWAGRPGTAKGSGARWLAATSGVHLAVAVLVIWAFYAFRFAAFAPGDTANAQFYRGDWTWILEGMGGTGAFIDHLRRLHALPEAFLYGFAFVLQFSRERAAFLNGAYSTTGWLMFFPFAFLVKSTLAFLILVAAAGVGATHRLWLKRDLRHAAAALRPLTPLVVLFVVYWVTSLASHLNIGHRHILPVYPVLFIGLGWLGRWIDPRRPLAMTLIIAAVGWHGAESLRARPHYLAYFNQFVGGSQNGWRHLVDSSLDWGQDLPGLSQWLAANADGKAVFLAYFGTADPAYEGIRATPLVSLPDLGPPRPRYALSPGVYAISATLLQHVYSNVRGPWTSEREREFQQLHAWAPAWPNYPSDVPPSAYPSMDAAQWKSMWDRYEELRFARLCTYLRVRAPDAVIGHSIFIFRLNTEEIHGAVGGSLEDWRQLIERAVAEREAARRGK